MVAQKDMEDDMGQYVINGDVVDLQEEKPTAADLKRETGCPPEDWVMATMPGGEVQKLSDTQLLPKEADFSIVPPFTYGG
jgi:hypothetical protein